AEQGDVPGRDVLGGDDHVAPVGQVVVPAAGVGALVGLDAAQGAAGALGQASRPSSGAAHRSVGAGACLGLALPGVDGAGGAGVGVGVGMPHPVSVVTTAATCGSGGIVCAHRIRTSIGGGGVLSARS